MAFERKRRAIPGLPSHLRPRKTFTWLVLGVKKTPFGTKFHFIDSKTVPPESANAHLIPVFPEDAETWDYVIVVREDLAARYGWFNKEFEQK